jgi:hypothetical protein
VPEAGHSRDDGRGLLRELIDDGRPLLELTAVALLISGASSSLRISASSA